MVNQLSMSKSISIQMLRQRGMSERAIAVAVGVSRNAVRRQVAGKSPREANETKAPTGSAPTGLVEGSDEASGTVVATATFGAEVLDETMSPISREELPSGEVSAATVATAESDGGSPGFTGWKPMPR